jgi:hypothetical protein
MEIWKNMCTWGGGGGGSNRRLVMFNSVDLHNVYLLQKNSIFSIIVVDLYAVKEDVKKSV